MKWSKLISSLKKCWWIIFNYIIFISLSIVLLLHTDIKNLQQFIKNFGPIGKLMIIGYSLVWVTITEIVNCLIRFILKKIKAKRIMKNKIF
ncbi:hypothetical protein [Spiroplasma endosymbiont of Dromius quadrimaculatus]|uniref:hypothetical protein n=1 Tax=Spiroplasma endosymbiont of Dromius quadrimaculatus TaxID=3066283 RepID=UPI00313D1DD8